MKTYKRPRDFSRSEARVGNWRGHHRISWFYNIELSTYQADSQLLSNCNNRSYSFLKVLLFLMTSSASPNWDFPFLYPRTSECHSFYILHTSDISGIVDNFYIIVYGPIFNTAIPRLIGPYSSWVHTPEDSFFRSS